MSDSTPPVSPKMTPQNLADLDALHQLVVTIAKNLAGSREIDYLEIGVQEGLGLYDVLTHCPIRLAVGIDTWGGNYGGTGRGSPDHVAQRLDKWLSITMLLTGNSPDVLKGMRHPFDLILVDGDHSEAGCVADLDACRHLLKPSGIMLVDDLNHPAHTYLYKATLHWANRNGMTFKFHEAAYGVGELRWKSKP